MTPNEINHLLSGHFTRLINSRAKRFRDLYFVFDVLSITCNAGMGAWIHYHINDEGWIDDASRAFGRIGRPEIGDLLRECRIRYLSSDDNWDHWDDDDLSAPLWEQEDHITGDLFRHLMTSGFPLQTGGSP